MGGLQPAMIVIMVLNWVSWILLMAGVAAYTAQCEDDNLALCGVATSLEWWITWYQFALLIMAGAAVVLPAMRQATMLLLTMVTGVMMVNANTIYVLLEGSLAATDDYRKALQAYFAGIIMSMIFNLLWIVLGSMQGAGERSVESQAAPKPAPQSAPAQTAGQFPNPVYVPAPAPQPMPYVPGSMPMATA